MSDYCLLGHSSGIFGGNTALGATIIDGMDTLWIMGLRDRFDQGRDWIEKHLNFDIVSCKKNIHSIRVFLHLILK